MSDLLEVEVLIIGAGPAGLATANYLGLYGVRALVVEQNVGTVAEPRAVSVDDETLRSMQTLGLDEQIIANTLPGYGARYYSPSQKEFARIQPTTREYGHPRRSGFQQPEFEAALLAGLDRFPDITVLFGHRFERLHQDGLGVSAEIFDPSGQSITVRASFLAACDGGRSSVRKQLGIELAGSSFNERWLVIDCVNDTDATPASIAYCDHRRAAITIPGPGRTRRWEFLLKRNEEESLLLADGKIRDLLKPYIGSREVEVIRKIVYTFHARIADRWRIGRVFLLGDAAHLTPPYAGQGLNSGQRDAANFSWKAAAVVKGQSHLALMDTYEAERRDHAWSLIRMAIQIGWVMVPRNWFHTYAQIIFFRLAGVIPPVRDYFLGMKFKPLPRFRNGFLCEDALNPRDTLVGRMLPQPDVCDANGQVSKLDDILGPGFALLAIDLADVTELTALDHPVWRLLAPRRVSLTVDKCAVADGVTAVSFVDNLLRRRFEKYAGCILLIRPDRYVAAAFTAAESCSIGDRLSEVLG